MRNGETIAFEWATGPALADAIATAIQDGTITDVTVIGGPAIGKVYHLREAIPEHVYVHCATPAVIREALDEALATKRPMIFDSDYMFTVSDVVSDQLRDFLSNGGTLIRVETR